MGCLRRVDHLSALVFAAHLLLHSRSHLISLLVRISAKGVGVTGRDQIGLVLRLQGYFPLGFDIAEERILLRPPLSIRQLCHRVLVQRAQLEVTKVDHRLIARHRFLLLLIVVRK